MRRMVNVHILPRWIVDLGVRAFDKAETAKEGDSLNRRKP